MTLRLEGKKAIVAEVKAVANDSLSAVVADYRGLTVTEMTELRKNAREAGVSLRVVRNTLARIAVEETNFSCLKESLVGPTLLAFCKDEPGKAARLIKDFAKDHKLLEVRSLSVDGQLYAANDLSKVAALPTKDEGIALLMSVMLAPVTKLVQTFAEVPTKVVRTMAAVGSQKNAA